MRASSLSAFGVSLFVVAVLARCVASSDPHTQSVTRVDDLEILGDTDGSGVITARSGVRLTTPTTGPIFVSGSGTPNGVLTATKGSLYLRTDTAQIYQNTDGAMTWSQVAVASAASVSILTNQVQSAGSLTTMGNIDWVTFGNIPANNIPIQMAASAFAKRIGGYLRTSFTWNGGCSTWSGTGGAAVTSTSIDTVNGSALNSNAVMGPQNFGGINGCGYSFYAPGSLTPREVRFYHGQSGHLRITATIDGVSASALDTSGGGETRITYSGNGFLNVTAAGESQPGTSTVWIQYVLVRQP